MPLPNQRRAAQLEVNKILWALVRQKVERDGITETAARAQAYRWLSTRMGIAIAFCHVMAFNDKQLEQALGILRPYAKAQPQAQGTLL